MNSDLIPFSANLVSMSFFPALSAGRKFYSKLIHFYSTNQLSDRLQKCEGDDEGNKRISESQIRKRKNARLASDCLRIPKKRISFDGINHSKSNLTLNGPEQNISN